jgi:hypothetical protein
MGEYVTWRGGSYKLGTCEALYYIRYADLARLVAAGEVTRCPGNGAPVEYLRHPYQFRFPFPREDHYEPFSYDDYDAGLVVNVATAPDLLPDGAHHNNIYHALRPHGGYNINTTITCPQEAAGLVGDGWRVLEIVRQVMREDALRVLVRCPYCRGLWSLDYDDAERLAAILRTEYTDGYYHEVARRVLAGYEVTQ